MYKLYAAWIRMKNIFTTSCFIDFNWSKIGNDCGLSRNTAKKYIEAFIKLKWAYYAHGCVYLISNDELKEMYGVHKDAKNTIKINRWDTIKRITYKLRHGILKNNQLQFDFIKDRFTDVQNPHGNDSLKQLKRGKSFFKKSKKNYNTAEQASSHYQVSIKTLSNKLKISPASVCNLISELKSEKRVTVFKSKIKREKTNVPAKYSYLLPNSQFIWNGFKYTVSCNKYQFN